MKTLLMSLLLGSLVLASSAFAEEPKATETPTATQAPATTPTTDPAPTPPPATTTQIAHPATTLATPPATTQTTPPATTQTAPPATTQTTPPATTQTTPAVIPAPVATPDPGAAKPAVKQWWEIDAFIKRHPGWSEKFKKALDNLRQKQAALKTAEADLKAQKDKAERAKLTVKLTDARKAVYTADIEWHKVHVNFKNHQKDELARDLKVALQRAEQLQKSVQHFMHKDFRPSMERWQDAIRRLQDLIRKTK